MFDSLVLYCGYSLFDFFCSLFNFVNLYCGHFCKFVRNRPCTVGACVYSSIRTLVSSLCFFTLCLFFTVFIHFVFIRHLEQVDLVPPSIKHLQLDRFLKNGKGLFCLDLMIHKKIRTGQGEIAVFA